MGIQSRFEATLNTALWYAREIGCLCANSFHSWKPCGNMRREVGIWSTVFLWINLIHYWIRSSGNTAGMEGAGGREIFLCNNSSPCYPAMTRSFNWRWDSKLEKLEKYWVFNRHPSLEMQTGICLPSLCCGEFQEKVFRAPSRCFNSVLSTGYGHGCNILAPAR